ncbi:MAG TPA: tetratricopeptide repeat-containing sensor histidine kinase [Puia sp.]|nr:tetratricopeptide repeat-containing sensor histidine kinase [Puia sp.]
MIKSCFKYHYKNNRTNRWFLICAVIFSALSCNNLTTRNEHPEYFNNLFKKVDSIGSQSNAEETMHYIDSAFYAFPNPGLIDKFERYDCIYKYWYFKKSNYLKAMDYSDSLLNLVADKTDNRKYAELYVRALFRKGDCYYKMKLFDDAFHYYYLEEEAVLTKIKDKCLNTEFDSYIPYLLYAQGKYLLAKDYFKREFAQQSECSDYTFDRLVVLQRTLTNIGLCYYNVGMPDSAEYYYDSTLHFFEKNEKKFLPYPFFVKIAKGVVYADKARILFSRNSYKEAENLFRKSFDSTRTGDVKYSQGIQADLANLYIKATRFKQADSVLKSLKNSMDSMPNEPLLFEWEKLKSDFYISKSELPLAYKYLHDYLSYKDSVDKKTKAFASTDINNKFENIEHKFQVETLEKETHIKTLYLIIAILASVMAIIIGLLVWNNLKRAKSYVRELKKTNLQIIQSNVELQKALISLEQSHKENTRILNVVAHDLKNPISAIRNLTYSLLQKEQTEPQKKVLEVIQESTDNSLSLINELLFERKKLSDIDKRSVNMKKMLQYCVDMLQSKSNEKNQKLILQSDEVSAFADGEKIWRVASNIISNAIKFSNPHSEINIKLEKKGATALLSVIDKGIGIPDKIADKVFTMSDEVRRIGTEGESSYGLGLSISKKIIEEHGGKIWFESEVGEGTVFYVELPCEN